MSLGGDLGGDVIVIGVGNGFRRDDGVGLAVAAAVASQAPPGVRVIGDVGDPCRVLDAWAGARLAVIVDAAVASPAVPGRIHRCTVDQLHPVTTTSSHGVDLATVFALGEVLDRLPDAVVLIAIEVADTAQGVGLSAAVAAALPKAVAAVLAELGDGPSTTSSASGDDSKIRSDSSR